LGDESQYYYARHPRDWYVSPDGADQWLRQYNTVIRQAATETGALLADVELFLLNAMKSGVPLHHLLRTMDNCDQDDGVHPTEAGHELYMECISEQIQYCLKPTEK
jgi:lysophospholipase L1-like esterase